MSYYERMTDQQLGSEDLRFRGRLDDGRLTNADAREWRLVRDELRRRFQEDLAGVR